MGAMLLKYTGSFVIASPDKYGAVVPARHAYSHSTSLGRRKKPREG